MKKEFRHRLWAWVLLVSLVYPVALNFAHSFAKHNLNHPTAQVQIDKVNDISCAVFHYIHNYNVPLDKAIFELKVPEQEIFHIAFLQFGFSKTTPTSISLRAPPIC
jgi:hypothetical protein